ncbi:S8 family serine peptidase [Pollutibacter soli]|uniref:S8 family serine peptidase n=1 Tax=Pollutibacter soli TaxID=3034157 RepID=UPI003013FA27
MKFFLNHERSLIAVVECSPAILKQLLMQGLINSATEHVSPSEEGGVISYDQTVNAISAAHDYFPSINGTGETVSVKENRMDTQDIDIAGRYADVGTASSTGSTHATIMTTLIAGLGNTSFKGLGVAFRSRYTSSDFSTVLPDQNSIYRDNQIRIQNHSYGIAVQSFYGNNARAFDISAIDNPELLHVFSSGNSGTLAPQNGKYAGISGVSNLTGNMKFAKNVLVVGAIDSALNIPAASSGGPAYDGRIKPELVAFAEDGSSGSAALVSGSAALIQQAWLEKYQRNSTAQSVKAILINSADDVHHVGPDYRSGFGNMNLNRALATVRDNRIFEDTILPLSEKIFPLTLGTGLSNLKATLVWTDPVAVTMSEKALINDLDFFIKKKSTNEIWEPWILSIAADTALLFKNAIRGRDTLNNIEQVSIDVLTPGEYELHVSSRFLSGGRQTFSVVWQVDTVDKIEWIFPVKDEKIEADKNLRLRWQTNIADNSPGEIAWSADNNNWNIIEDEVSLNKQEFTWKTPAIFTPAYFRIVHNADTLVTGPHAINAQAAMNTGWICDSALIYWNKKGYTGEWLLYRYNGDTMQLIRQTPDSFAILSLSGPEYFSVAPLVGAGPGLSSNTINIFQQGTGCFVNSFVADLVNDNKALIRIQLGTLFGIKKISIRKLDNPSFILYETNLVVSTSIEYIDENLHKGINRYLLELELTDGKQISSGPVEVYFNESEPYIIYPNPVRRGQTIQLLQRDTEDIEAQLYDATGRFIKKFLFTEKVSSISTASLGLGWYYLLIVDEQKNIHRYKFVVF